MDKNKKLGGKSKGETVTSKTVSPSAVPSTPVIQPPPIDEELAKSIEKFVQELTKQQHKENKDYNALEAVVSEWLKCFIIVGFDLQGNPKVIGHSPTEQDYLSLVEHFRYTLLKIMMRRDGM